MIIERNDRVINAYIVVLIVVLAVAILGATLIDLGVFGTPAGVAEQPASGAPANISEQTAPRSDLLRHYNARTAACVDVGVSALLDLGERDPGVLTGWALRRCGGDLAYYLRTHLERPQADTDAYVLALVRSEIDRLVRERAR